MKIYKNPFVTIECYFVPIKKNRQNKFSMKAPTVSGYFIEKIENEWKVRKANIYEFSLEKEYELIAKDNLDINKSVEDYIANLVLDLIEEANTLRRMIFNE